MTLNDIFMKHLTNVWANAIISIAKGDEPQLNDYEWNVFDHDFMGTTFQIKHRGSDTVYSDRVSEEFGHKIAEVLKFAPRIGEKKVGAQ